MRKTYLTVLSAAVIIAFWGFTPHPAKVYFIPSLHKLHVTNTRYNYDSLQQLITKLQPEVIAVEIRQIDIDRDSSYLKKNYPYEMWMMKYWFPKAKIVGFDWVGDDIEGKPIPANYWQEISPIKKYERELNADSIYSQKAALCSNIAEQRLSILKNHSLKELIKSDDALLTKQYYQCLAEQLSGSKYLGILHFYAERNKRILINIRNIMLHNKKKTIAIITGDDHYNELKDQFKHDPIFNE